MDDSLNPSNWIGFQIEGTGVGGTFDPVTQPLAPGPAGTPFKLTTGTDNPAGYGPLPSGTALAPAGTGPIQLGTSIGPGATNSEAGSFSDWFVRAAVVVVGFIFLAAGLRGFAA